MSADKGKFGEMRVLRLLTRVVDAHGGRQYDVTRHTNTNTPDSGADLVLEHPDGFLSHLQSIGQDSPSSTSNLDNAPTVKTRIDVKNTNSTIGPEIVKKFAGDVRRNPDCKGHILMGGKNLSELAAIDFKNIQEAQKEVGKTVMYVPNSGIATLEAHYEALPAPRGNEEDNSTS